MALGTVHSSSPNHTTPVSTSSLANGALRVGSIILGASHTTGRTLRESFQLENPVSPIDISMTGASGLGGTENRLDNTIASNYSGGIPHSTSHTNPKTVSYANVVQKELEISPDISGKAPTSFVDARMIGPRLISPKQRFEVEGKPAIKFTASEIAVLAAPFSLTLVGKFAAKEPPTIGEVMNDFKKLNLKKGFNISFLDRRHLIIRLNLEEDYTKLWLKSSLFIAGSALKLVKWSPDYTPAVDSPLVPCWITLKKLPIMLFHRDALFEISKLIGTPLRMDQTTAQKTVFNKARICVEVDASSPPPKSLWLDLDGIGHEIGVDYDEFPDYCTYCHKLGHSNPLCYVKNPTLKPSNPLNVMRNHASNETDEVVDETGFTTAQRRPRKKRATRDVNGRLTQLRRQPPVENRDEASRNAAIFTQEHTHSEKSSAAGVLRPSSPATSSCSDDSLEYDRRIQDSMEVIRAARIRAQQISSVTWTPLIDDVHPP